VYLVFFFFYALILVIVNGKSGIKCGFVRFFGIHGFVLGAAWLFLRQSSASSWAKNISSGRLYQTPNEFRGPNLPSTLPLVHDILTPNDYQSQYLDSFNRILDYGHTGNRQWNEMLQGYWIGYDTLPSKLQEQLSSNVVLWTRQQQRRILTKNHLNQWAELDEDGSTRFAHKELMKASNPIVEHTVRWTDFLLSEAKYGYWRDTSMHMDAIPSLLRDMQGKLLRFPLGSRVKQSIVPASGALNVVVGRPLSISSTLPFPSRRRTISSVSERSRVPPEPPTGEPYPGAWLKVGDVAEARLSQQTSGMMSFSSVQVFCLLSYHLTYLYSCITLLLEQKPGDWVKDGDAVKGMYAEKTNGECSL